MASSRRAVPPCRCRCPKFVHEHWRASGSTYCSRCGADKCAAYRPQRWWHRLLNATRDEYGQRRAYGWW